jgi:uncharacterized tellurite resistance protein B-like protein
VAMDEGFRNELLEILEGFFATHPTGLEPAADPVGILDRQLQMAAVALMVCVVRVDHESRQDEHRVLERAIGRALGIDASTATRLVRLAEERLGQPSAFRGFLQTLNSGCSDDEKRRVLQGLWRIAYADAELAAHEEYFVRKVAEHLHLTTADLIEAKLRARETFLREDI